VLELLLDNLGGPLQCVNWEMLVVEIVFEVGIDEIFLIGWLASFNRPSSSFLEQEVDSDWV